MTQFWTPDGESTPTYKNSTKAKGSIAFFALIGLATFSWMRLGSFSRTGMTSNIAGWEPGLDTGGTRSSLLPNGPCKFPNSFGPNATTSIYLLRPLPMEKFWQRNSINQLCWNVTDCPSYSVIPVLDIPRPKDWWWFRIRK